MAALAGALTIAVQLPAVHWFYYYILWFLPFVLIAVLGAECTGDTRGRARRADARPSSTIEDRRPALAGAA